MDAMDRSSHAQWTAVSVFGLRNRYSWLSRHAALSIHAKRGQDIVIRLQPTPDCSVYCLWHVSEVRLPTELINFSYSSLLQGRLLMLNPFFECKYVFVQEGRKSDWMTAIAVNPNNTWCCYVSNSEVSFSTGIW